MSMNELEAKVAQLRELRRMADELADEIAATEDSLKAYMTANSTEELYGSSFKITWKEVTGTRLDIRKKPFASQPTKARCKEPYPSKQEGVLPL